MEAQQEHSHTRSKEEDDLLERSNKKVRTDDGQPEAPLNDVQMIRDDHKDSLSN